MTKNARPTFLGLVKIALLGCSFPLLLTSNDWIKINTWQDDSLVYAQTPTQSIPKPVQPNNITNTNPPIQEQKQKQGDKSDVNKKQDLPSTPQPIQPTNVKTTNPSNQEEKQEEGDKSDADKKQDLSWTFQLSLLGFVVVLYLGVLRFFPLLLLRLPAEVKIPKTPFTETEYKLPVGVVIWLKYRPMVLDAWVKKYIDTFYNKFLEKETVGDRKDYVSLPVKLNQQEIEELTAATLRKTFEKEKRVRVLIWGDGGSGKTTIACQIAKLAMEQKDDSKRLTKHLMLPVLIEDELDLQSGEGIKPLMEAIVGEIQELIDSEQTIIDELLVEQLLRQRRILLIVDHFSEMSEQTHKKINPDSRGFPANALIITSRIEEKLKGIDAKIETLCFDGGKLAYFIEQYLKESKKWHLFEDEQEEFLQECAQLARIVGDKKSITVLLAKLYAERMINAKENFSASENSLDNIPDLIIDHLEKLNQQGERETRKPYPTVIDDAKLIAWKCLEQKYKPSYIEFTSVVNDLGEDAEKSLEYFEKNLRLIRQGHKKTIGFALDPLAEYLAGLYLVEDNFRDNEESWHKFLAQADSKSGEEIKGFLLAVRECCLAKGSKAKVPDFVIEELGKLTGIDPDAEKTEQMKRRIRRLINDLFVPEVEDRKRAAEELGKIGIAAKSAVPALLIALKDENPGVRLWVVRALENLQNNSESVLQGLLTLLKDDDYWVGVADCAAKALSKLGNASEAVQQELLLCLKNDSYQVRSKAAEVLGNLGDCSQLVIEALLLKLEDPEYHVRLSAVTALEKLGDASQPVIEALLLKLEDPEYQVCRRAASALGKLGDRSQSVIQALLVKLEDSDFGVRFDAAISLGLLGDASETVIQGLVKRLEDKEASVRDGAIIAFSKLGDTSELVQQRLIGKLKDENHWVRMRAAEVLGKLGIASESLLQALLARLEDTEFIVCLKTVEALSKLGNPPEPMLQALLPWLENKDDMVRRVAMEAVEKLTNLSETS
ncbi:HEAT repeat domain-containing protein [Dolichospermum sp. UHCC 0259]|uniref:HEAT repeat domain-containing protein n=1 Tax=Dolichospermum sp. UHCC 0259 TaxID=2590010 RepID=UPI0014484543|nr:HEAT repeat domain-containing protein [Dolichospermum sp. UHCC 0259]MTJ50426.1 NACHT domain-containing protein [Dolichospermum sp. UHCC 0259]